MLDDSAAGSDVALDEMRQTAGRKTITIWPSGAALGSYGLGSNEVYVTDQDIPARVGGVVTMTGSFEAGMFDRIKSLGPKATKTATYQHTAIDDTGEALLTESGTVTGTETDGSAVLDDTGAVFTSTWRDGFHWVRLLDNTGRILSGYIGTTDPDGNDTKVNIYSEHARSTQNWIEGGATAFDMSDTPLTYEVYKQGFVFIYHALAWSASGGNARWKINLQDSLDGSSWADLTDSKLTLTAAGAARVSSTTQLFKPWVRIEVELDASSGSLTFIGGYNRLT